MCPVMHRLHNSGTAGVTFCSISRDQSQYTYPINVSDAVRAMEITSSFPASNALNLYVSPYGDNSDGTTWEKAYKTFNRAAYVAANAKSKKYVIHVLEGEWITAYKDLANAHVIGGYYKDENNIIQRNPFTHYTVLYDNTGGLEFNGTVDGLVIRGQRNVVLGLAYNCILDFQYTDQRFEIVKSSTHLNVGGYFSGCEPYVHKLCTKVYNCYITNIRSACITEIHNCVIENCQCKGDLSYKAMHYTSGSTGWSLVSMDVEPSSSVDEIEVKEFRNVFTRFANKITKSTISDSVICDINIHTSVIQNSRILNGDIYESSIYNCPVLDGYIGSKCKVYSSTSRNTSEDEDNLPIPAHPRTDDGVDIERYAILCYYGDSYLNQYVPNYAHFADNRMIYYKEPYCVYSAATTVFNSSISIGGAAGKVYNSDLTFLSGSSFSRALYVNCSMNKAHNTATYIRCTIDSVPDNIENALFYCCNVPSSVDLENKILSTSDSSYAVFEKSDGIDTNIQGPSSQLNSRMSEDDYGNYALTPDGEAFFDVGGQVGYYS